jgi:hypothetical protein
MVHDTHSLRLWTLSVVRHSKKIEITTLREMDLFPSSDVGKEAPSLRGAMFEVSSF